ncbi:hypothetical protein E1B28_004081 [Marasmius oreades]|uniref:DUF6534 domain-containing protein n=1 Tax=Marasmius oreades TaxID=181124 RepID=A0A9P7UXU9_9AGAR|nr:uncharacterized protein E1B28_004081 [Marasmius oreades]KAG7096666.1 hypothetical protein E1B28_004081 [Marasmius oreades]
MISKLIVFSVSTGLLTSICAIASLISVRFCYTKFLLSTMTLPLLKNLVWGKTLIYVTFYFCLGRLYSNSLLATLNARKSIRGETEDGDSSQSFSLQTFPVPRGTRRCHKLPRSPNTNIAIKIDTTHELVRDSEQGIQLEKGDGANTSVAEKSVEVTAGEKM